MKGPLVLGTFITGLTLLTFLPTISVGSNTVGMLPSTVSLTLHAGDTGSYQVRIHNGNGQQVIVSLSIVVAQVPEGAHHLIFP